MFHRRLDVMVSVRLKLLFKVKIGKDKSTIFDGAKGENNFLKLFLSPFMIRSYALSGCPVWVIF